MKHGASKLPMDPLKIDHFQGGWLASGNPRWFTGHILYYDMYIIYVYVYMYIYIYG